MMKPERCSPWRARHGSLSAARCSSAAPEAPPVGAAASTASLENAMQGTHAPPTQRRKEYGSMRRFGSTGTCMTSQRHAYESGHKPKCLVIVDDTAEWDRAVYYAARWAMRV